MKKKRKSKKTTPTKPRNPYVLPARMRKGGAHKDKRDKRKNENHNPDYQEDCDD